MKPSSLVEWETKGTYDWGVIIKRSSEGESDT